MIKTFARLFVVALLAITAGCSNQIQFGEPWQLPEPAGPEDALIFGYISTGSKEDPRTPEYVRILRMGKVYAGLGLQGIGEKTYVFTDGRFIAPVKPGEFNFNAFYANKTMYQITTSNKDAKWFTIKPGQIYYVGSVHVKQERAERLWRPGEFSIERIDKPGERELLQWVMTISKGTGWEKRVRQRAGSPVSSSGASVPSSTVKPR